MTAAVHAPQIEDLVCDSFFERPYVTLDGPERDVVNDFIDRLWPWMDEHGHEGCKPDDLPGEADMAWDDALEEAIVLARDAYREAPPVARSVLAELGKKLAKLAERGRT